MTEKETETEDVGLVSLQDYSLYLRSLIIYSVNVFTGLIQK